MRSYHMETERLGFSRWGPEDLGLAILLWGDPEVTRYISATGGFTGDEIAARLDREMVNGRLYNVQYWPVFICETQDFIGCCGLRPYDLPAGIYEFGVHLLPTAWGCGYAAEAGRAVIDHTFGPLNASDLFAGHNPGNAASRAMLIKLGFHYVRDEYYPPTGLHHPSYLYK